MGMGLCLALVSCSSSPGNPAPRAAPTPTAPSLTGPTPTPSATGVVSATPTAAPPPVVVPSNARPATPQGAAAFARYYFQQVSRAFTRADGTALTELSDPACGTCRNYIAAAASLRQRAQHVDGDVIQVVNVESPPVTGAYAFVTVSALVPAHRIVRNDRSLVEALPAGGKLQMILVLHATPIGWRARAVQDQK